MKNYTVLLGLMFIGKVSFAQTETSVKKAKDTIIKTEIVNVVTSYAPKVTDAFKIKQKPIIKLSEDVKKKILDYNFISVPVASTFIPKSGTLKGIKIEKKERLFNNYVFLGFGNNSTPYLDTYIHKNTAFDNEYGIGANFISSANPVKNATLSSSFYNIGINLFYKQEERYFNWKAKFNAERNKYNWYGLPTNINFTNPTINSINEEQIYKLYKIAGEIEVPDSYITNANISIGYFSDILNSNEFTTDINANFSFPFGRFGLNLEDLKLSTSITFLGGNFENNYEKTSTVKYNFLTAGINPSYQFYIADFNIKIGANGIFSMDAENNKNKFYIYPDIKISHHIIKQIATIYAGASGNLHTNSFEKYANKNPYISPTLQLLQTHQAYNIFGGIKGIVANHINYNLKGSYKNEQNKPLFILNKSKSDGITTAPINGQPYKGYEYGNSFNVLYDDVKNISIFGELTYDASKNITFGLNGRFNKYTQEKQAYAWNLPKIKAEVFGAYKRNKWYASTNLFFVGKRTGILHTNTEITPINLKGYFDININGGYHINSLLTIFARFNNVSNSNYQRFTNFNSQGIQAIGGVIWKFDSLF